MVKAPAGAARLFGWLDGAVMREEEREEVSAVLFKETYKRNDAEMGRRR